MDQYYRSMKKLPSLQFWIYMMKCFPCSNVTSAMPKAGRIDMQWVSVKDKLPETGVEVLVEVDGHRGPSWRNNHNLVAFLTKSGCWIEERHGWNPLPVTHWMPLPEPPAESREGGQS